MKSLLTAQEILTQTIEMFKCFQQLGFQTDLVHDLRDVLRKYPTGKSDIVEGAHYDVKNHKRKSTETGSSFNNGLNIDNINGVSFDDLYNENGYKYVDKDMFVDDKLQSDVKYKNTGKRKRYYIISDKDSGDPKDKLTHHNVTGGISTSLGPKMNNARYYFKTQQPIHGKITKEMIEKEALMYLNGKKQFSQHIFVDNPNSISEVEKGTVISSSCIWGQWGSFALCEEIIGNVCKRLRVREPKNPDKCNSYNIDVGDCECEYSGNKKSKKPNSQTKNSERYMIDVEENQGKFLQSTISQGVNGIPYINEISYPSSDIEGGTRNKQRDTSKYHDHVNHQIENRNPKRHSDKAIGEKTENEKSISNKDRYTKNNEDKEYLTEDREKANVQEDTESTISQEGTQINNNEILYGENKNNKHDIEYEILQQRPRTKNNKESGKYKGERTNQREHHKKEKKRLQEDAKTEDNTQASKRDDYNEINQDTEETTMEHDDEQIKGNEDSGKYKGERTNQREHRKKEKKRLQEDAKTEDNTQASKRDDYNEINQDTGETTMEHDDEQIKGNEDITREDKENGNIENQTELYNEERTINTNMDDNENQESLGPKLTESNNRYIENDKEGQDEMDVEQDDAYTGKEQEEDENKHENTENTTVQHFDGKIKDNEYTQIRHENVENQAEQDTKENEAAGPTLEGSVNVNQDDTEYETKTDMTKITRTNQWNKMKNGKDTNAGDNESTVEEDIKEYEDTIATRQGKGKANQDGTEDKTITEVKKMTRIITEEEEIIEEEDSGDNQNTRVTIKGRESESQGDTEDVSRILKIKTKKKSSKKDGSREDNEDINREDGIKEDGEEGTINTDLEGNKNPGDNDRDIENPDKGQVDMEVDKNRANSIITEKEESEDIENTEVTIEGRENESQGYTEEDSRMIKIKTKKKSSEKDRSNEEKEESNREDEIEEDGEESTINTDSEDNKNQEGTGHNFIPEGSDDNDRDVKYHEEGQVDTIKGRGNKNQDATEDGTITEMKKITRTNKQVEMDNAINVSREKSRNTEDQNSEVNENTRVRIEPRENESQGDTEDDHRLTIIEIKKKSKKDRSREDNEDNEDKKREDGIEANGEGSTINTGLEDSENPVDNDRDIENPDKGQGEQGDTYTGKEKKDYEDFKNVERGLHHKKNQGVTENYDNDKEQEDLDSATEQNDTDIEQGSDGFESLTKADDTDNSFNTGSIINPEDKYEESNVDIAKNEKDQDNITDKILNEDTNIESNENIDDTENGKELDATDAENNEDITEDIENDNEQDNTETTVAQEEGNKDEQTTIKYVENINRQDIEEYENVGTSIEGSENLNQDDTETQTIMTITKIEMPKKQSNMNTETGRDSEDNEDEGTKNELGQKNEDNTIDKTLKDDEHAGGMGHHFINGGPDNDDNGEIEEDEVGQEDMESKRYEDNEYEGGGGRHFIDGGPDKDKDGSENDKERSDDLDVEKEQREVESATEQDTTVTEDKENTGVSTEGRENPEGTGRHFITGGPDGGNEGTKTEEEVSDELDVEKELEEFESATKQDSTDIEKENENIESVTKQDGENDREGYSETERQLNTENQSQLDSSKTEKTNEDMESETERNKKYNGKEKESSDFATEWTDTDIEIERDNLEHVTKQDETDYVKEQSEREEDNEGETDTDPEDGREIVIEATVTKKHKLKAGGNKKGKSKNDEKNKEVLGNHVIKGGPDNEKEEVGRHVIQGGPDDTVKEDGINDSGKYLLK